MKFNGVAYTAMILPSWVVAVDQAGQTLLDDVEERVERRECRVLGIGHDLLLGCCVS